MNHELTALIGGTIFIATFIFCYLRGKWRIAKESANGASIGEGRKSWLMLESFTGLPYAVMCMSVSFAIVSAAILVVSHFSM